MARNYDRHTKRNKHKKRLKNKIAMQRLKYAFKVSQACSQSFTEEIYG